MGLNKNTGLIMKLNLGCGSRTPRGWVNVDYSLGARFMKVPILRLLNGKLHIFNIDWSDEIVIHDLRKEFPWADNSIDVVYSSHTLEHLSREEGRFFLQECHRVLKKGGLFRVIVPDLRALISKYLNGDVQADEFILKLEVLSGNGREGFLGKMRLALVSFPHKCMYDEDCLSGIMRETGFQTAHRKPMDSAIEGIEGIERQDRTVDAVIIEGTKP